MKPASSNVACGWVSPWAITNIPPTRKVGVAGARGIQYNVEVSLLYFCDD